MKWEYKEVEYKNYPSMTDLNIEGGLGWELVHMKKYCRSAASSDWYWNLIFKRRVE